MESRQKYPRVVDLLPVVLFSMIAIGVVGLDDPERLYAQQSRSTVEITPLVGVGVFPSDLTDPLEGDEGQLLKVGLENSITAGLSLGIPISQRLTTELEGRIIGTEFSVSSGGISAGGDMDLFIVSGNLRYSFAAISESVTLFLIGGAGVKGYESSLASAETDLMANFGGGLVVSPPGFADIRFGVRDFMSSFDSFDEDEGHFQHDLMFTTGVTIGVL